MFIGLTKNSTYTSSVHRDVCYLIVYDWFILDSYISSNDVGSAIYGVSFDNQIN